ncbi:ComEA family DNA-binding protein [Streptomyces sp. NPDC047974]|uniref:ComEA family DNA-binding protein n=1 Tax=Streptomyces sp. NPDC047974 TaxID=3154343 RepID=UPI0033C46BAE
MDLRTASSVSVSSSAPSRSARGGPGPVGPRRGAPPGRARRRARVRRVLARPGPAGGVAGVVRERGDALFPPPPPPPPAPPPLPPPSSPSSAVVEPVVVEEPAVDAVGERRWRAAVRERLPLWVQTRCGLEPRSLAALAVVLVVAACAAGGFFWAGRPEQVRAPELVRVAPVAAAPAPAPGSGPASGPAVSGGGAGFGGGTAAAEVVVDVGGKVRRPGVLTLPAGSRVADALRAAGGVRAGADLTGLNRARVLLDGEQVLVGVPGAPAGGSAAPGVGPGAGPGGSGAPLNLNTATAEQFDGLPGVGPVLARRIVDHRTERGGFRSVEELREVDGIGERRFADLQPLVRP